jgi:hypothetical protein
MKVLVLMLLSVFVVSCASKEEANKVVEKEAKAATPTADPRTQYERAISMVQNNPDLKDDQKNKLVDVINTYATKNLEIRMNQSQYRAVLVNEMLNSGTKKNPKVDAAKKGLQKLNKDSSEELGKFIRDFKYYSGNTAANFQPAMKEVIRIN